jgi:hypothetical protein
MRSQVPFSKLDIKSVIAEGQPAAAIESEKRQAEAKASAAASAANVNTTVVSNTTPVLIGSFNGSIPNGNAGSVNPDDGCKTCYPKLDMWTSSVPRDTVRVEDAARYFYKKYPSIGLQTFAIMIAESRRSDDRKSFISAGGNNYGGVQTDCGIWGYSNFIAQFCRIDNVKRHRMFAAFKTPQDFMDFLANRLIAKGFNNATSDQWTTLYINKWWSPKEKASYVAGTSKYQEKLSIFNSAANIFKKANNIT